jgi:hypothetical protein
MYIRNACIYVSQVEDAGAATEAVEHLNSLIDASVLNGPIIKIALFDNAWVEVDDPDNPPCECNGGPPCNCPDCDHPDCGYKDSEDYMKGMTPDEYAAWQQSWRK